MSPTAYGARSMTRRVSCDSPPDRMLWPLRRFVERKSRASDFLVISADFREFGEARLHFVAEERAHVVFALHGLDDYHQLRLVRRGADQNPRAVFQRDARAVDGVYVDDLAAEDLPARLGESLIVRDDAI